VSEYHNNQFDDVVQAQEWLINACLETTKENKKAVKSRLLRFKHDLEESHIKLRISSDLPSTKDASNANIKEMLMHAAEAGNLSGVYESNMHLNDYSRSNQEEDNSKIYACVTFNRLSA
jgi:regulator of replication initiation timing